MDSITHVGQPYVDEPRYAKPKDVSVIAWSLAKAFGSPLPRPILLRHDRVKLQWMDVGADGKLVPQ